MKRKKEVRLVLGSEELKRVDSLKYLESATQEDSRLDMELFDRKRQERS